MDRLQREKHGDQIRDASFLQTTGQFGEKFRPI